MIVCVVILTCSMVWIWLLERSSWLVTRRLENMPVVMVVRRLWARRTVETPEAVPDKYWLLPRTELMSKS